MIFGLSVLGILAGVVAAYRFGLQRKPQPPVFTPVSSAYATAIYANGIVGLSASGQTFYTFILENLEKFGALKAIGAKGRELIDMILCMATFTALAGDGLGIAWVTLMITIARARLPGYAAMITDWNLALAFELVLLIAAISSSLGVRKVARIETFDIFRS